MKWDLNRKQYKIGHRTVREKFLLLPKTINGIRKLFEKAKWEEEIYSIKIRKNGSKKFLWKVNRWINGKEKEKACIGFLNKEF